MSSGENITVDNVEM